jgi:hypothetical protein
MPEMPRDDEGMPEDDVYYEADEILETLLDEEVIPEEDAYYEDDEMLETPPDDEGIPEADVYYEDDEMPETPPDDEGIPFILEHHSQWMRPHYSLLATPHNLVRSTDEFHEFAETYFFTNWQSEPERAYITEIMARFDDDFFEDRMLILSYGTTSTIAANLQFNGILPGREDALHLRISSYMPSWWTPSTPVPMAEGQHFFFVSLERNDEITTIYGR